MKTLYPLWMALAASLGNALVAYGQKKAAGHFNPFLFGAGSLFLAAVSLWLAGILFTKDSAAAYWTAHYRYMLCSALGFVMLNVFLTLLYRHYGASYYTLYSTLAILTTSVGLAVLFFHEKMNRYYTLSVFFALVTIYFFMKGKNA